MRIHHALALALAGCAIGVTGCADGTTGVEVASAAPAPAPCEAGGTGTRTVRPDDVAVGPLTLVGARYWIDQRRSGFDGLGYKIPAVLPAGTVATLIVPPALRPYVRLVYSLDVQDRVREGGILAGSRAVRFAACKTEDPDRLTSWPGGILVDRPRCIVLRIRVEGERTATSHRVPVGRRCR